MKSLFRCFLALLVALTISASDAFALNGSWRGNLKIGQTKLPLVFHFSETASGETQCTLDSPSQGAMGISAEVELCTADSISLTCKSIGMSYNGKVSFFAIKGVLKQNGYVFPLDLNIDLPVDLRRPQTPKAPFPYTSVDTVFTTPDGAVMSATLTVPLNALSCKMPAVVMVTGSGPQNRDEELFEHKPFAVIADCLARNGIASLRYDDRGTGKSTGNFSTATTYTFKDDAASGIAFLRTFPYIDKVGVLGHSEGGTIALMLGAEQKTDFIVSLAGMAISGKETLMKQNWHALESANMSDVDRENSHKLIGQWFDTVAGQVRDGVATHIDVDSLVAKSGLQVPADVVTGLKTTQRIRTPWFDTFLTLAPRECLGKIECPILAINGDKDMQVHPYNLTVIKDHIPQAEAKLMPGLNHLMQHAVTGEVAEYGEIRETISPDVLDEIVNFIKVTK